MAEMDVHTCYNRQKGLHHMYNYTKQLKTVVYFWIKYGLGQKYYAAQVRPNQGSNS